MNLFSILERAIEMWPDTIALADHQRRMTYRELHAAAESLAGELRRAGIQEGDKVGVLFPRGVEEIVVCFAVARLRGIVVQLSPASKSAEIARLSERLIFDSLVYDPAHAPLIPRRQSNPPSFAVDKPIRVSIQPSGKQHTASLERQQLLNLNAAAIGFSSGTTSESKAIILSHDALLARARAESECFSIAPGDSVLYLLSITYGFAPPTTAALVSGAKLLIGDAGAPQRILRIVGKYGATVVYAAPMVYRIILNESGGAAESLRNTRLFLSTGSRLPDSLVDEFRLRVGHEIANRYGLNECGMVCVNLSGGAKTRGSIGRPAGYEVKLHGAITLSQGKELSGELMVRGAGMFDGYLSPWRVREELLEQGWFHTGDLATLDKDGCYWIVGRCKDMINVSGLKVVPAEIEDVLLSHPDVEEALVFGVAHPRFGEVPHAKIKLVAGSRAHNMEILHYVKDKVAFYKSPRAIEIVDQLPKTLTGKIKSAEVS